MMKDAKQAAKLEKKLKVLLGGYQVGGATLQTFFLQRFLL